MKRQNHFAAMFIISFAVDGATGTNNNDACLNSVAQEFGNFAVITKNGVPLTPPNPLGLNSGKNNLDLNNVLPMALGDQLLLTMHDTPAGLEVILKDLTSSGQVMLFRLFRTSLVSLARPSEGTDGFAIPSPCLGFHLALCKRTSRLAPDFARRVPPLPVPSIMSCAVSAP